MDTSNSINHLELNGYFNYLKSHHFCFKENELTMCLWGTIIRSKAEGCWSTSIHFCYLERGKVIVSNWHLEHWWVQNMTLAECIACDASLFHREEHLFTEFLIVINKASRTSLCIPWTLHMAALWSEKDSEEVWEVQGRWQPHGSALETLGSADRRNHQAPQRRWSGSHSDPRPRPHVAIHRGNEKYGWT